MNAKPLILCSSMLCCALAVGACGRGSASAQGAGIPSAASLQRFEPREDGWQNDPANQLHPTDPNPLRRALGDAPIIHNLFGVSDLMSLRTCAKQHAGLKLSAIESSVYAPRCPTLERDLVKRARDAGFTTVTANEVFDLHLVHIQGS
ncbi:MAG: hypothetical protein ISP90_00345 [Nevskia sp.]|nr:hypothetical protein [Nevskia sp.]